MGALHIFPRTHEGDETKRLDAWHPALIKTWGTFARHKDARRVRQISGDRRKATRFRPRYIPRWLFHPPRSRAPCACRRCGAAFRPSVRDPFAHHDTRAPGGPPGPGWYRVSPACRKSRPCSLIHLLVEISFGVGSRAISRCALDPIQRGFDISLPTESIFPARRKKARPKCPTSTKELTG
jgi:hypothetical protein